MDWRKIWLILGAALHLLNNLFVSKGLPSCARMGSGAMISWTYICSILVLCIAKNLISVIQEIEHKVFLAISSLTLLPISTFIPSSRIVKQTIITLCLVNITSIRYQKLIDVLSTCIQHVTDNHY